MVMTHDGQLLIAANDDEVVFLDVPSMISGKPDPVVGHLSDGHSAGSFYANVTKDDAHLFVSDEYAETITVIDLAKARRTNYDQSAIVGKIPVGILSISLKFSPDEQWLYTTSERAPASWNWPIACPPDRQDRAKYPNPEVPEGGVILVNVRRAFSDPATAVVAKAPAGCSPVRLAISGKGDLIWVSARRSDAVLGFDTSKLRSDPLHARIGSVTVGTAPVGIAVLPDSKHVVVANSNRIAANPNGSETVSVIDMDKVRAGRPAVVGKIPAGAFPREFSQSSDKRTLFLGNYLSDTLEVIDLKKLSVIAK
jgi:DNA-binding beta-propeller fold protein YncE